MLVTIDGKEIKLELTAEQKAIVERALRPQTGWERAEKDGYCFIGSRSLFTSTDCYSDEDDIRYKRANYFSDTEFAENIDRAQTLQRKLWRRSAELCEEEKINWKVYRYERTDPYTMPKYIIRYNYVKQSFSIVEVKNNRNFGDVYFDTAKHAEIALNEFRDELMWYFTEFKVRMDL